jgi:type I restriction enzyme S subunit
MELKPGYKKTEVGVIPEDWEAKSLGDVAEVVMGQSPLGLSYNRREIGAPLINGPTEFTEKHPIKIQWTSQPTKICKRNDLLLCVRGSSTGRMNIADDEYCIGRGVAAIRAKPGYDTSFVTFQVDTIIKDILALTTGSTFPNIDGRSIRTIEIPLPPLPEQRAIAAALSDVDALISGLDQLIAKKRDLKQAAMQQLLTGKQRLPGFSQKPGYRQSEVGVIPEDWEPRVVGDLVDFSGGSQPPRSTFLFSHKDGYLRLIQIRDYKTDEYATYIPEALANKRCSADDIMIGRYGPPIFQILRGIEGAYNVAIIKAIPSASIDREFLFHFLKQDSLFRFIESLSQRSSGQTGIEMPALKGYGLPLPPLPEQRAIATVLSDMDAEIATLEQRRDKTRALKQGMMQQLLTGRIRLV